MRRSFLSFAILASAGICCAQESSTISLNNGVQLRITTSLGEPTGQEKLRVDLARASGNSFYRIFRDQNNLAVFAYELEVGLSSDGTALSVTAKPCETEFAARFPGVDAGKPVPSLSSDHPLGPLGSGQKAELGLFEIPGMGLSVKEIVEVKLNEEAAGAGGLRLAGVDVSIDGKHVAGPGARGAVSGRYVMFYIPGQGGYFFATEAVDGRAFMKAGSIDGNRMKFTVDNTNFECIAEEPILKDSGGGELWVLHDPTYRPEGNWTQDVQSGNAAEDAASEFFTAGSDSLNWWFR